MTLIIFYYSHSYISRQFSIILLQKGVMLSHDNLYFECMTVSKLMEIRQKSETLVSYLPLSHIAGQCLDVWAGLINMSTIVFADKMFLKDNTKLFDTIREVQPTCFLGVPRIWEKIMEGMQDKGRGNTGFKKHLVMACKNAGLDHHLKQINGIMYAIGQKTIYPKVLEALGFSKCRIFWSGAAPLRPETLKFFLGFDIVIHEVYGMSETTGVHTVMKGEEAKVGVVGTTIPGCETKVLENGGEICMRGRNTMMGYLNREDKTKEDVDEEGWMHSGDIGSIDADGILGITGW